MAPGIDHPGKSRRWAVLLPLAWLPALLPCLLIRKYGVNVPFWDDWYFGHLIALGLRHELTWDYLFRFHNEHRLLVPRLLFLALTRAVGWDCKILLYLSLAIIVMGSFCWGAVALRTHGRSAGTVALIFLANLTLFSPVQSENWLWPMAMQNCMVLSMLGVGMWIMTLQIPLVPRFVLAVLCAWISALSGASGMLLFVVLLPLLLGHAKGRRIMVLILWTVATGGAIMCYRGMPQTPDHLPPSFFIQNPIQAILYFLSNLGGCLNAGWNVSPVHESALVGLAIVGLFFIAALYSTWKWWCLGEGNRNLVWIMTGLFVLGCACLTTWGRLQFGLEQSLERRYALFSGHLVIATIFLVASMLRDLGARVGASGQTFLIRLGSGIAGAFVLLWALADAASIPWYREYQRDRLVARSALQFSLIAPDRAIMGQLLFVPLAWDPFYKDTDILDRAGYFKPALLRMRSMTEIAADPHQHLVGHFDMLVKQNAVAEGAYGWAVLPDRLTPADTIVLSYRTAAGDEVPFCLMDDIRHPRPDVVAALGSSGALCSGWQRSILIEWVPKECSQITAWAYDSEHRKAYRIENSLPLQR